MARRSNAARRDASASRRREGIRSHPLRAERRGVLQVAGAALLWSLGGIGIKAVAEPPLKIAAYRSATAAVALFLGGSLEARAHAGDAVAVVSGVFYAGLVLLLRRERGASAEAAVTWGNVLVVVALAPLVLRDPGVGARSAAILVLLGTVQVAAAQVLFLRGLEHVRAAQAALVTLLEPIANPLWVLLVLGEVPSVFAVAGGAGVLRAIAWRTLGAPVAGPALGGFG